MIDDRRQRVLIVDDDPSVRRILALSLAKQGYQTNDACDGREALDAMHAGKVDLVLLDLMMPKVTGWDVLAERAAEPELRKIPVIIVSGERGDDVPTVLDDGIYARLSKPVNLEVLKGVVKSCLESTPSPAQNRPRG